MKKRLLVLLILFLGVVLVFSENQESEEFTGVWKTETFLTERMDGQLVASEAPYAFPYLGISEIRILDSGFIVFQIGDSEYRAFYELRHYDYDNKHLICSFKNGEELILKLVKAYGGWKYLIRLPADSIMAENFTVGMTEMDMEPEDDRMGSETEMSESDAKTESGTESELILFTGLMRKK